MEILTFYAINFEPFKIKKRSAPQNDHLNLSFVKKTYVNANKMARKVIIFQKENGNTFTLFIIFLVKSLQKLENHHF